MKKIVISFIVKLYFFLAFQIILFFPHQVFAHLVNQDVGEFYAGMLHPLSSAEHLLPLAALALLAGWSGMKASRWTVVVFPFALVIGTWIGNDFAEPGFSHIVNLLTIVAFGAFLAVACKLSMTVVLLIASATGLLLGFRSGIDMANAGVGYQFIPGVGLTGFIIVTLISAWVSNSKSNSVRTALRITGGFIGLAGIYLFVNFAFGRGLTAARSIGLPTEDSLISLVKSRTLSLPVIASAFLAATAWGAAHALTPGHGKAIAGAYLIGSRGTPMHAIWLGLTVTATHTMGVFALGLVALFASRYLLPEQLTPWLAAASGLIVGFIGASLFLSRVRPILRRNPPGAKHLHDHVEHDEAIRTRHHHHDHGLKYDNRHHHGHGQNHDHDFDHEHRHIKNVDHFHNHGDRAHSHLPPGANGADVTWRSLLGLGISGGLLPCPAALVLLLTAISIQRTGLGILLVVAFSLGLAGVLTIVGLLFIKGSRLLGGTPANNAVRRYAPAFSALVVFFIGVAITINAFVS